MQFGPSCGPCFETGKRYIVDTFNSGNLFIAYIDWDRFNNNRYKNGFYYS